VIDAHAVFRYTADMRDWDQALGAMRPLLGSLVLGLILVLAPAASTVAAVAADVVIHGARVIDPESGLDDVRDVGIAGGRIVAIETSLDAGAAHQTIDGAGLVLAPGFIDLHVHGHSPAAHEHQARDGVTTALELEWGYPEVGAFLESRRGRARVNYGASVSHGVAREIARVAGEADRVALRERLAAGVTAEEPLVVVPALVADGFGQPLEADQQARMTNELRRGLAQGGIGIGMPHAYYPGAGRAEILGVFEFAASAAVPIFTHVRGRGLEAVQEVVANAAATGASLHVVHVNSIALGEYAAVLALLRGAQARGLDITTEAYPYTAASTNIRSALFDGDWQARTGQSYDTLQWQETGERLTAETFARYREQGGVVINHMMQESWIEAILADDSVMIASDGMPYAPGAHPRTAGTFSRVLGRYVRERGLLELPAAIRRMTLLPARRLEAVAPQMARKGRVQVGADADLVLFDPATVIDTATYESGPRFSRGIRYVFVNGIAVVADGETVPDAYPGQPIIGVAGAVLAGDAADGR
jgi:cytosine/adenosine deaminase-related metal-dependent hydrolase